MHKFKHGLLHSGSKKGKLVKSRNQAIAIMLSEKRAAGEGHSEYKPRESQRHHGIGPDEETEHEMMHSKKKKRQY